MKSFSLALGAPADEGMCAGFSPLFKLVETGAFSKQLEAPKALGDYKITLR
jgi:hypothetical protein